jgi:hypothetical protein
MPRYLFEAAYTHDSWATQVQSRENVMVCVKPSGWRIRVRSTS